VNLENTLKNSQSDLKKLTKNHKSVVEDYKKRIENLESELTNAKNRVHDFEYERSQKEETSEVPTKDVTHEDEIQKLIQRIEELSVDLEAAKSENVRLNLRGDGVVYTKPSNTTECAKQKLSSKELKKQKALAKKQVKDEMDEMRHWCKMLSEDTWKQYQKGEVTLERAELIEKLLIITGAKYRFKVASEKEEVTVYAPPKVEILSLTEVKRRKQRVNGKVFITGELPEWRNEVVMKQVAGDEPLIATKDRSSEFEYGF